MKAEILALLRERGDYVSGQELCERFGVSRTAVWKAVNQLKKEGYRIEAVNNRGYLLAREIEVYGKNELESRM
ncbi:MAG: HTH domain-containing protein, partial [Acetatifactor sp.]|nr:HTH domain-containing protein [Acetatifactor sp.]